MKYFKKVVGYSYYYTPRHFTCWIVPVEKIDWNKVRLVISLTIVPIILIMEAVFYWLAQ